MSARVKSLKLTEAEFLGQVLQLAKLCGWRTAHFRPARTDKGWRTAVQGDGKGFPDLILIRHKTIIVAELKAEKGFVTNAQAAWLQAFHVAGVAAYTWYPLNWSQIEEVLR